MKHHTLAILGFAALLACAASVAVAPAARAQGPDVLTSLLTEVRGLRAAMEQVASAGPRVELALGRLQLQEQRINNLTRRLDDARSGLANAQRVVAEHESQVQQFEAAQREGTEPKKREEVEELAHLLDNLRRTYAAAQAEVQRLTVVESELAGELAAEQTRWTELNQRVEELERTLGRR